MEIGVECFLAEPSDPREVARMVEELGFESLFLPEHTHIPASSIAAASSEADAEFLRFGSRLYDPFTALALACAVTERIRLGTGVCIVLEHDPIALAKRVATLDVLSGDASSSAWVRAGCPRKRRITAPSSDAASTSCASGSSR
jgi:alkanesulfonate monooxygenase SsuD/methylene tetrahydromethanopterin reductase-like flavin-dependent oxidoreductase (luciferase family)